jgi:hypothetical protein
MGPQHRGTRWGQGNVRKDFLLLVSIELFPFRGEPEIPNSELLELATNEGTKVLFVGCSCTTDVINHFMSDSIVLFVSKNLTNRFEQIGVSVGVLKRSDGSRHRRTQSPPSPHPKR